MPLIQHKHLQIEHLFVFKHFLLEKAESIDQFIPRKYGFFQASVYALLEMKFTRTASRYIVSSPLGSGGGGMIFASSARQGGNC